MKTPRATTPHPKARPATAPRRPAASVRPEGASDENRRLVHELEVHQVELELQNNALRDAHGQLEDSRARYAELYDYAPIGHVTLDRDGVIRELNLTSASLLGKERRYLYGQPLRSLLAPRSRRALDAHVRACLQSRAPSSVELEVPLPHGGLRIVELVSVPPHVPASTPDGGIVTFHSAMIDISERKRDDRRRDELLQREHEARVVAEGVNVAKQEFLAVVSHELRTPLAPMMMWVKALRTGGISDSLRARALDAIDTCLKVQVAMIDDLVDVARGQHGKLRIHRRPIDLQPVVGAAIEALAPSAAAKQIEVSLEVDPTPAWVAGDPTRLQQVVANLVSNAIKFTREAGHIALSLRTRGTEVVLAVRDDGEGIDADLLESIFEPFRQFDDGVARRHGGLGLGLTIVRQLVSQHDGQVTAESAGKGRGACFTVTLPYLNESTRRDGQASPWTLAESSATATARELAGVRVLVIEDHEATRDALAMTLQRYGAEVTTASSAREGRAALERVHPQVLVSDIGMTREDGYAFIRKLRLREKQELGAPHIPALALTAHASEHDREQALAAGFDRHLTKPIEFDRLVSTIGALARESPPPEKSAP
ncbi:MAG TPA: ATP-binding protein [Polyangia bacterium]|nr:ATP-binding protein [Polyangia bacterium]